MNGVIRRIRLSLRADDFEVSALHRICVWKSCNIQRTYVGVQTVGDETWVR